MPNSITISKSKVKQLLEILIQDCKPNIRKWEGVYKDSRPSKDEIYSKLCAYAELGLLSEKEYTYHWNLINYEYGKYTEDVVQKLIANEYEKYGETKPPERQVETYIKHANIQRKPSYSILARKNTPVC